MYATSINEVPFFLTAIILSRRRPSANGPPRIPHRAGFQLCGRLPALAGHKKAGAVQLGRGRA